MEDQTQSAPLAGWQLAVIAVVALLLAWLCCGAGLLIGGAVGFGMGQSACTKPQATPGGRITPVPETPGTPIPSERPYLGIRFIMRERGAEILEVVPDSPADKAGLQVGDIILEVDGRRVRPSHPLPEILFSYRPGDEVTLTVERDGEEIEIPVTLGRAP